MVTVTDLTIKPTSAAVRPNSMKRRRERVTPTAIPLIGSLPCSMLITGSSVSVVERESRSVVSLIVAGPESELNGINILDSVLVSGIIPDPS